MRNLFFALLLANLGFGAWSAWYAPEPHTRSAAATSGTPIRLVSEVAAESAEAEGNATSDEAATAAAPDESAARSIASSRCVSVGPFPELADAAAAAARLRAAGLEPSQRDPEGDIWVGYWVRLDSIPSRTEANEILAKLRENGIREAYLIPDDDAGHIISLGVFADVARAGRLREQVRGLGFEPNVVDRSRRGTAHWIDVEVPSGRDLDFEMLEVPDGVMRLEQRACGAAAN